jgi:hypothetical protein
MRASRRKFPRYARLFLEFEDAYTPVKVRGVATPLPVAG